MDIAEIAKQAGEFQAVIDRAKARIAPTGFAWYPYDSLGNFFNLDEVLTAERRRLLELIGNDPVLDVGCGDGDLAFFLESLGCRVDAIDNPYTNYNGMRGVWSVKSELQSSLTIHSTDIDVHFKFPLEQYGAAFILGVLYHLKNPFHALEQLAAHARYCFLSTRIAALTPDARINFYEAPLAYLLGPGEVNYDPTNYWIFSNASLRRLLERTHWEILDYKVFGDPAASGPSDAQTDMRAFCCARSRLFGRLSEGRLIKGWHTLEEHGWRWTERHFSIEFPDPPPRGVLTFRLALPDALLEQLGPITLSGTVNGIALPAIRYTDAGEHLYRHGVATNGPALVEFSLDKALPPQPPEKRELGVIVLSLQITPAE